MRSLSVLQPKPRPVPSCARISPFLDSRCDAAGAAPWSTPWSPRTKVFVFVRECSEDTYRIFCTYVSTVTEPIRDSSQLQQSTCAVHSADPRLRHYRCVVLRAIRLVLHVELQLQDGSFHCFHASCILYVGSVVESRICEVCPCRVNSDSPSIHRSSI